MIRYFFIFFILITGFIFAQDSNLKTEMQENFTISQNMDQSNLSATQDNKTSLIKDISDNSSSQISDEQFGNQSTNSKAEMDEGLRTSCTCCTILVVIYIVLVLI